MSQRILFAAKEEDIPAISAINHACMPENYTEDIYKMLLPKTVVARIKGSVVGYAMMATLVCSEEFLEKYSQKIDDKIAITSLVSIAVLPEHRNKGIGKQLLDACIRKQSLEARVNPNTAPIVLYVRKNNTGAQHLYRKANFKHVHTVPGYYKNPTDDAFVMVHQKK